MKVGSFMGREETRAVRTRQRAKCRRATGRAREAGAPPHASSAGFKQTAQEMARRSVPPHSTPSGAWLGRGSATALRRDPLSTTTASECSATVGQMWRGMPCSTWPMANSAGARRLDDEMLLALHHRDGVGQFEQAHARVRILGGDGFVAEVEAEAIRAGLADDAREQHRGGLEGEVGIFVAVAEVPQHRGAGRAFAVACATRGSEMSASHRRRAAGPGRPMPSSFARIASTGANAASHCARRAAGSGSVMWPS